MISTKYEIECQKCHGSLTIIYTVDEGDEGKKLDYEKHLVWLMNQHLIKDPGGHPNNPEHPGKHDGSVTKPVQQWFQKIKPV